MAGALISERITDDQFEGTILDFASRGLLVLKPRGETSVQVHLQGESHESISALDGYEREIWKSLVSLAGSDHGTINSDQLAYLRQDWGTARSELQRELIERGWFDPAAATSRRRPFHLLGKVGMVAALISLFLIIASNEGWAAIGMTLFLGAGVAAFIRGAMVPDITLDGEKAAAPWWAYKARVTALEYDPKLDADLPYIVALGIASKLEPRLRAASEKGYSPLWFDAAGIQGQVGQTGQMTGFYPSWVAFHSGVTPMSGGFGGGGFGGGAAVGGGGSAGSF
jgi:hypothetical protein